MGSPTRVRRVRAPGGPGRRWGSQELWGAAREAREVRAHSLGQEGGGPNCVGERPSAKLGAVCLVSPEGG